MVKLKYIGNFKSVPQIVNDIINGNTSALGSLTLSSLKVI